MHMPLDDLTAMITRLNPPTLPDTSNAGYSQISIAEPGALAFVSGQVASHPDGLLVPRDIGEQTALVTKKAGAALDALGATTSDVVLVRAYVVDLTPERLEQFMAPFLEFLDGARPSLTGIGVAALAGPDLQVEIEMTVRLPNWIAL